MFAKLKQHKYEILLVLGIMLVSGFVHGYNLQHFPYYENDEGTYMSQAWAVLEHGKLAPYTFWYDHAPAGWIFIALWLQITGGIFVFGDAVASGRILMLILHVASTGLLYVVTRKFSGSMLAAAMASLVFALSPLGIYYQRRVLLDNIMIFWSLLSVVVLLREKLKLRHIILSSVFFGVAVLTKENAVFFFPAIFYALFTFAHPSMKIFAILKWLAISGLIVSTYFFYAILKGEFLPPGPGEERVSLIETLSFHLGRGHDVALFSSESDFMAAYMSWMGKDPYVVVLGTIASLMILFAVFRSKEMRVSILLVAFSWLFLLRGGLVIDFYVAALLPFLAMSIGIVIAWLVALIPERLQALRPVFAGVLVLLVIAPSVTHSFKHVLLDETTPQMEAVNWVRENLSPSDRIIIDQSIFLEVRNPNKGPVFEDADWFWKVQYDPDVRFDKYNNDWRSVDYIVLSHEMVKFMETGDFDFLLEIFDNSEYITGWRAYGSDTYLNFDKLISTNGDWMQIYKVKDPFGAMLENSWEFYKDNFIISYGQVIEPWQNNRTTSEGQSYALLRSVYMNDQTTFDGVLQWTKDNLGYRGNDNLFSWIYEIGPDGEYYKSDHETASDADEDITLALLFAYQVWGDEKYLEEAKILLDDMWEFNVIEVAGQNYFAPNTNPERVDGYLLNPSYFSPASYRIFAEVDQEHDWLSLVDSSYDLLERMAGDAEGAALPLNWVMLTEDGDLISAEDYVGSAADQYGFDAFRVMWRVALDLEWFGEERAHTYLERYQDFFLNEWQTDTLASIYDETGAVEGGGTISTDTGILGVFHALPGEERAQFYADRFEAGYNTEGFWGEKTNYYGQNWAWLGTALFSQNFRNLWELGTE